RLARPRVRPLLPAGRQLGRVLRRRLRPARLGPLGLPAADGAGHGHRLDGDLAPGRLVLGPLLRLGRVLGTGPGLWPAVGRRQLAARPLYRRQPGPGRPPARHLPGGRGRLPVRRPGHLLLVQRRGRRADRGRLVEELPRLAAGLHGHRRRLHRHRHGAAGRCRTHRPGAAPGPHPHRRLSRWATGCRRSTPAPATTVRPDWATAAAPARTRCGWPPTAPWTKPTPPSAWSWPRRAYPMTSATC